jgi:hypothetical protein
MSTFGNNQYENRLPFWAMLIMAMKKMIGKLTMNAYTCIGKGVRHIA